MSAQLSEANHTIESMQLAHIQANSTETPLRGTSSRKRAMQTPPLGASNVENTPRRSARKMANSRN